MVNYRGDIIFFRYVVNLLFLRARNKWVKYTHFKRVHSLRTSLELTPVRTVTCVTLRIINETGRVSEFVYFSFFFFFSIFVFFFFYVVMVVRRPQRNYTSCKLGIWHISKVFVIITIISRIQHLLIVRREKLVLKWIIFALRHPNNCVVLRLWILC